MREILRHYEIEEDEDDERGYSDEDLHSVQLSITNIIFNSQVYEC
jgi:hypothetical protein